MNDIISFIDKYCSTDVNILSEPHLQYLQSHKHKYTCQREMKGTHVCRFNMPKPPMDRSTILMPLPVDFAESQKKYYKKIFRKIMDLLNYLYDHKEDDIMQYNFEQFLNYLNINSEDYILALRSELKSETIFLKRKVAHININGFNKDILELHKANMDIQFILNPYSLCNYLVNYIQKSMAGISKILRDAIDDIKAGNMTIKQKLLKISSKFVNGVEVSAQEAAYTLLGLHMSEASRATIFINTFPPNERVKMLKSKKKMEMLPKNSTDIFALNHLDYYVYRPKNLEKLCYAEFVAAYEFTPNSTKNKCIKLLNKKGYIHRRKLNKVIRYRNYSKNSDPENFYRENIMLFFPWRNETLDILDKDVESLYTKNYDTISNNSQKFNKFLKEMNALNSEIIEIEQSNPVENNNDNEFKIYGIQEIDHDLSLDLPNLCTDIIVPVKKAIYIMEDSKFDRLIRSLNMKQKQYLSHLMNNISKNIIFYEFISG